MKATCCIVLSLVFLSCKTRPNVDINYLPCDNKFGKQLTKYYRVESDANRATILNELDSFVKRDFLSYAAPGKPDPSWLFYRSSNVLKSVKDCATFQQNLFGTDHIEIAYYTPDGNGDTIIRANFDEAGQMIYSSPKYIDVR